MGRPPSLNLSGSHTANVARSRYLFDVRYPYLLGASDYTPAERTLMRSIQRIWADVARGGPRRLSAAESGGGDDAAAAAGDTARQWPSFSAAHPWSLQLEVPQDGSLLSKAPTREMAVEQVRKRPRVFLLSLFPMKHMTVCRDRNARRTFERLKQRGRFVKQSVSGSVIGARCEFWERYYRYEHQSPPRTTGAPNEEEDHLLLLLLPDEDASEGGGSSDGGGGTVVVIVLVVLLVVCLLVTSWRKKVKTVTYRSLQASDSTDGQGADDEEDSSTSMLPGGGGGTKTGRGDDKLSSASP